jgi:hypothetical protein
MITISTGSTKKTIDPQDERHYKHRHQGNGALSEKENVMPRGRPKTLPPCKFVGVLIPLAFLDKVEDVRRAGQKGCSSYSFSEAIRDVLAKGLEVTWKPVQHNVESAPNVEQKKEHSFEDKLQACRKCVRSFVATRPQGQHWTTAVKRAANALEFDYWTALDLYHGSNDSKHIERMRYLVNNFYKL